MPKLAYLTYTAVLLLLTLPGSAQAQDATKVAGQVPPEVSEVVSGGSWTQGDASGSFRAIVVNTSEGGQSQAHVIVQWVQSGKDAAPKVTKSSVVKEIKEKKLQNAFLAMDTENENELTVIVTSYDAKKDEDISMLVKLSAAGSYEILPAPKDDSQAPAGKEGNVEKAKPAEGGKKQK